MVTIKYPTKEELETEIRDTIREAGFADLKRLAKAFHYYGDWAAYQKICKVNGALYLLGLPQIPDCCMGLDHNREDEELYLPGEAGAPYNYMAST